VITGMEIAACQQMAVPAEVMQHVVSVESGYNPFAIGVVGGQLARQPQNLAEALATVHMLDEKGYNFSLGVAQVNRANLEKYGLKTYEQAFDVCSNLTAAARILSQCYASSGKDWGKSFSCYYSGDFTTGFRDGYVQKIYASMTKSASTSNTRSDSLAIPVRVEVRPPSSSSSPNAATGAAVATAEDSARYRVAIRSTALGTTASGLVKRLVARVDTTDIQSQASLEKAAHESPGSSHENIQMERSLTAPASVPSNVFEPQVHSLGEAFVARAPADEDQTQIASNKEHASVTNSGPTQPAGADDAFVF
jgi:type IV secretion system protein VirB1